MTDTPPNPDSEPSGDDLSPDAQRLVDAFGARARQEFNDILDERMRVNDPDPEPDPEPEPEPDPPRNRSIAERLGFG